MADLLLVDDDEDLAWILSEQLQASGHETRIAHDGEEGLRLLSERLPDVVLLDVEMPRLDGPSMAYRMFVHNCGMENIPVVLISGVQDVRAVAHRVGTPYFLPKPFDTDKLDALLVTALTEHALPRPPV